MKPAKGAKGHLLYNPFTGEFFFRIYNEQDRSQFIDYDLCCEDIEIEIVSDDLVLHDHGTHGKLDWSPKVLGREATT